MNGPEAAVDDLFVGKKAVIAALPENSRADVERLADVWERCGAIIHHLTPENHDTVFATVSHMPHLLAYGLVDYVANHPKSDLFSSMPPAVSGISPELPVHPRKCGAILRSPIVNNCLLSWMHI